MTFPEFEVWYRRRFRGTSSAWTIFCIIAADAAGALLSFGCGFFFVNLYDMPSISFRSFVTYWPYLPVFIVIFQMLSLYPGIALAPAEELRHITIGSGIAFIGIIFSRYIDNNRFDFISAAFLLSFFFSVWVILICRSFVRFFLRKTKTGAIPAVIYGGGYLGRLLVNKLLDGKNLSYVPVLILDENAEADEYRGVPIIHDTSLGSEIVRKFNIKMAMVTFANLEDDVARRAMTNSVSAFRYSVIIPPFFNVTNIWLSIRDFNGILGFAATNRLRLPWNRFIKRTLDLLLVILGGLIALPFMLIIALLVKITSPGAVLFGHTRIGRGGKIFKAYKFRSMVKNASEVLEKMLSENPALREEWNKTQKLKDDPRITKFGKFLRRTSLDELPQLLNILKGDMSLVGPRPVVEEEKIKYGADFERIFSVRPGLSGMWQISGRSNTDYAERISFDTYYLQSWSTWLDLWVLYKTIGAVLGRKGAY